MISWRALQQVSKRVICLCRCYWADVSRWRWRRHNSQTTKSTYEYRTDHEFNIYCYCTDCSVEARSRSLVSRSRGEYKTTQTVKCGGRTSIVDCGPCECVCVCVWIFFSSVSALRLVNCISFLRFVFVSLLNFNFSDYQRKQLFSLSVPFDFYCKNVLSLFNSFVRRSRKFHSGHNVCMGQRIAWKNVVFPALSVL